MPPPGHIGKRRYNVLRLSVRPFVRPFFVSSVTKLVNTNESILMPIGRSSPRGRDIKRPTLGGQGSKVKDHSPLLWVE